MVKGKAISRAAGPLWDADVSEAMVITRLIFDGRPGPPQAEEPPHRVFGAAGSKGFVFGGANPIREARKRTSARQIFRGTRQRCHWSRRPRFWSTTPTIGHRPEQMTMPARRRRRSRGVITLKEPEDPAQIRTGPTTAGPLTPASSRPTSAGWSSYRRCC